MSGERKKTMAKNFVLVTENPDGAHFCEGVYQNAAEAWGNMWLNILDFAESYKEDGDVFKMSLPYEMEGDGGFCVEVKYKSKNWTHEPETMHYYILFEGEVEIKATEYGGNKGAI